MTRWWALCVCIGVFSPLLSAQTWQDKPGVKDTFTISSGYFSTNYAPLFTDPDKPQAIPYLYHYTQGTAALNSGNYKDAIDLFDKAIEENPREPLPY